MSYFNKFIKILDPKIFTSAVLLLIMMFFSMLIETLSIGMVIPAISIILDNQSFFQNDYLSHITLAFGSPSRDNLIISVMFLIVFVFIFKSIYLVFFNWFQARFIFNVQISLSDKLFTGYMHQPYLYHLNRNSSSLIRNIITEVNTFASCSTAMIILITETMVFLGISLLLIIYEPVGSIMSIAIFCLAGLSFYYLFKNKMSFWGTERQKYDEKKIQYIQEGIGGIKESKIYGKEDNFIKQFYFQAVGSSEMGKKISFLSTFPRVFLELIIILIMSIFVVYLITFQYSYESIIATLGLFAVAAFRLLPSINKIIGSIQLLRYNLPVINLIHKEINSLEEYSLSKNNYKDFTFKETISLKDLSFSYDNKNVIFDRVNFDIKRGEKIGLIGETGSGKSTLVDIILGLLIPSNGQILVDGINIQSNIRGWQANLGYVPQTIFLGDDTLMNNIAYGFKSNEIEEEKVERSLHAAQLHNFIESLDKKLETKVGEKGMRLSGGQRQRIGIARALYNSPEIIVFDEATSALDYETENEVMKTVNSLENKTIIIIAHRINTLKNCDKIYELKSGKLLKRDFNELDETYQGN